MSSYWSSAKIAIIGYKVIEFGCVYLRATDKARKSVITH